MGFKTPKQKAALDKVFRGQTKTKNLEPLKSSTTISPTSRKSQEIAIAVLPLQNISSDPKIDMFCEGLVMDLITDLSRFKSLGIISYNSIKNFHPNEKIGGPSLKLLNLDYVVKGLVHYNQSKLKINLQLINVSGNRLIWAERFLGSLEDLFVIQEEIVEKIVSSLPHYIDHDILSALKNKGLTNLTVYECCLMGMQELKRGTLASDEKARTYFQKAIEIDPGYSRAYTGISLTYFNEWSCQLWNRWEISQKGAFEWAQKAVNINPWDHISTTILSRIYLFAGEFEKAEHNTRKAIRLNPNDADNLVLLASGLTFLGYLEEAYQLYLKAKRLNPINEDTYLSCAQFINFELGNFSEAIKLGNRLTKGKGWVDMPAFMAAAHYYTGNMEAMVTHWEEYLVLFQDRINLGKPTTPLQALQWMIDVNPYMKETKLQPFWEYMGKQLGETSVQLPKKPEHPTVIANQFHESGGIRHLNFQGVSAQLPDRKGFQDIAQLMRQPNQEVHCTELMGAALVEKGTDLFDEKAKKSYQKRILHLQSAIQEAETLQHYAEVERLQTEYDQLLEHLSKASGLGGRTRKTNSSIDKARSAVTWRIRDAIKKIDSVHESLAKHLKHSIKTGIYCAYQPEHELDWGF